MNKGESIQVIKTADGSNTFYHKDFNEIYHSRHGAYTEAMHVFINAGLKHSADKFEELSILEVGFGTGLNCILTYLHKNKATKINYTGIDTFPLAWNMVQKLAINQIEIANNLQIFQSIIDSPWNESILIEENFSLLKRAVSLIESPLQQKFNIIYFDAFAPTAQAEMWTTDIFNHIAAHTIKDGVLVTYCAKGQVRRNIIEAGFSVERIEGPPGKREMIRATKII